MLSPKKIGQDGDGDLLREMVTPCLGASLSALHHERHRHIHVTPRLLRFKIFFVLFLLFLSKRTSDENPANEISSAADRSRRREEQQQAFQGPLVRRAHHLLTARPRNRYVSALLFFLIFTTPEGKKHRLWHLF